MTPTNDQDALVLALKLAITAPTESDTNAAIKVAIQFVARLSELDVERCKKRALQEIAAERAA
jgi:hypothetical protein